VPFARAGVEQCVGAHFALVAETHAGRPALVTASGQWTYAELRELSDRIAAAVLDRHGAGNLPTAILLGHDAVLIATLLALLRIGRICVPLDPRYPAARSRQILHESGATLLITDSANAGRLDELGLDGAVLNIDDTGRAGAAATPMPPVCPDDIAFIVYTSGSTGRPKGVYYDHRSLLHNTMRYTNALRIAPQDRMTLLYSCSVIGSIRDLYGALLNGACLCMLDVDRPGADAIRDWLLAQRVTIYNSVTTLFRHFVADLGSEDVFPDVRVVRFGGEAVLRSDIAAVARHCPQQCIVYAGYGTSETGTAREIYIDPRAGLRRHTVPAGYPVDDLDIRLLDNSGAAVATGAVGEVCVRSRYIARGYWRRPDLDDRAFRTDPDDPAVRIYHTGDLGRLREDGLLELLGRMDAQVKIRGNRIEIGEIELALRDQPGVRQAAVVTRRDAHGARHLAACVVIDAGAKTDATALRAGLARRLPRHMVPEHINIVAELPLTANGKVDRARLAATPAVAPSPTGAGGLPRNAAELTIARIWARILDADGIGIDDSFFDLGANSLVAMRMLAELQDAFGASLSVSELAERPTIRGLAGWLRSGAGAQGSSPLYRVRRGQDRTPFFFVPGGTGSDLDLAFVYRGLAERLDPRQPFFGLSARHGTWEHTPFESVEEMAAAFVSAIRAVQPAGPYLLGGECVGGPVAFEMARQLEREGETVDLLVLMDSRLPTRLTQIRTALARARGFARRRLRHAATIARRLVHHGRILLRGQERGVAAYVADKARRARQLGRDELNLRRIKRLGSEHASLVYRYRPRKYGGRVILIAPRDSLGRGRVTGWQRYCRTGLEIRKVSGTHRDYLGPACIDETARALGACLCEAMAERRPDTAELPPAWVAGLRGLKPGFVK